MDTESLNIYTYGYRIMEYLHCSTATISNHGIFALFSNATISNHGIFTFYSNATIPNHRIFTLCSNATISNHGIFALCSNATIPNHGIFMLFNCDHTESWNITSHLAKQVQTNIFCKMSRIWHSLYAVE